MDLQLLIVLAVVVPAAVYVSRSFSRQFRRSDDESEGCSGCPATKRPPLETRGKPKRS